MKLALEKQKKHQAKLEAEKKAAEVKYKA